MIRRPTISASEVEFTFNISARRERRPEPQSTALLRNEEAEVFKLSYKSALVFLYLVGDRINDRCCDIVTDHGGARDQHGSSDDSRSPRRVKVAVSRAS